MEATTCKAAVNCTTALDSLLVDDFAIQRLLADYLLIVATELGWRITCTLFERELLARQPRCSVTSDSSLTTSVRPRDQEALHDPVPRNASLVTRLCDLDPQPPHVGGADSSPSFETRTIRVPSLTPHP